MAQSNLETRYLQFNKVPQHDVDALKRDNFNTANLNRAMLEGDRYFGTTQYQKNEGFVTRGVKQQQKSINPMKLFRDNTVENYYNGRSFRF